MRRRTLIALALLALGVVACVDIPDNMRAQFAPAGPSDRTNYVPGRHGSAPPEPAAPLLPWDAGVATPDAAPAVTPPATDGGVV
jgi:hypothetical protein